ncbi:MAG TPA: PAS domain S-box protein [Terriglobia bacterium]|nr:PAS domain S-box protein [Terriglobia bacterium]
MSPKRPSLIEQLTAAPDRITELERAELISAYLAAIIESADDAIITKDLNGIVTTWNPAAEKIFGYTAEEMIGKPVATLLPPDRPDEENEILRRLRQGQRIDHFETRRLRKDGRIIEVSITVSPIQSADGTVIGASKVARDMTERRLLANAEFAQLYLSAIVESAEDAIIGKNLDGIITSWNHGAQQTFGYTSEEIVGKPVSILIPPGHPNEEPGILARLRIGERIDHYETQRVRKDGRTIDVSLTISPIKDKNGKVIGASKIARDITERNLVAARERDALREAQAAREEAERASRAKDDFLATVSHELRTPLTATLGWARMLASGTLDEASKKKAIEVIERNVITQAQLIEDLLDISRIISGKLRIEVRPVETPGLINAALEVVRPAAEAKAIQMHTVVDSAASPISGDFQRLQQVIWNLLSNAVKFTPRGGSIRVVVQRVRSHIEISVIDSGAGIKPDFLPFVFQRFTQADTSITRSHGGLGMGLAISKSIVELHGGSISAISAGEGQGSTFIVKLPIAPMRAMPGGDDHAVSREFERRPEVVGLKILVVDDERDTCDMLRYLLDHAGAITQTATNAQDALEIIDTWEPDVLISDLGMPNVDGYELIKRIRTGAARNVKLPAVALTALTRIEDRMKALAAGYQMHVAKPIEPGELLTVVASLAALGKQ